jgi:MFS family permease
MNRNGSRRKSDASAQSNRETDVALAQEVEDVSSKERPAQRYLDAQRLVTVLLCLLFAVMYLDRINISAAAAPLKAYFALSNTQMGVIFSAFSWAYLGSVIFGGWGARKYGAKLTLIVCVAIVGVGTIATGLASGLITLFLARLVVGMGGARIPGSHSGHAQLVSAPPVRLHSGHYT